MGVLGGSREPFSITARTESTVVEFTKAAVVRLMQESAAFRETLETLYREKAVWTHLESSPVIAALPEADVEQLLQAAEFRTLKPGEVLYREGERATGMHLVRSGFLRVARRFGDDERVLQYFHEGDVCGISAVLFGGVHSATVSANTRAEVISIPVQAINALLKRSPDTRRRLAEEVSSSEEALGTSEMRPPARGRPSEHLMSLEGLLDDGVVQGREVLIINTAICTNCNNCVDSCERRHGHSRLDRGGMQFGDLLFPTACRHCEDPVCLMCSVSGIVREPDGEIRIVTENCIGCGACAQRCPYGNINMHPRKKDASPLSIMSLLGKEKEDIHTAGGIQDRIAVKCDLCFGYSDYACVTGCPVGAAMRIDPVKAFGRADLVVGLESKKTGELPLVSK
jgi:Fe-S-cluster-containing hydrogenase component 2/CRP-like cAMP-binding protein